MPVQGRPLLAVALVTGALAAPALGGASSARAAEADAWLASLYDAVAADLAAGRPLVVETHVPLCDNRIIPCGNARLGDGDDPARNLYWATGGGFLGWFGRRSSGWTLVLTDRPASGEILETRVWRRRFAATRPWKARGVRSAFDVYVIARAWRGTSIDAALEAYVDDLYGGRARPVTLPGGVELAGGGAAHVVAYVGHNRWMDLPPYDFAAAARRAGAAGHAKGAIAIACLTAPYLAGAVPAAERVPLVMTADLLFAGAHAFEGGVRAFAEARDLAAIRAATAQGYATGQDRPLKKVWGAFTNPSDRRWGRWGR